MLGYDDRNVLDTNVANLHGKMKCVLSSVMIAIAYLIMHSSHDLRGHSSGQLSPAAQLLSTEEFRIWLMCACNAPSDEKEATQAAQNK